MRQEELLAVERLRGSEDHRLAAAEREACDRVLVCHAARETQRIDESIRGGGVRPQPSAASGGAEHCGVQGDDRPVAVGGILVEDDLLVPEIGECLQWHHALGSSGSGDARSKI